MKKKNLLFVAAAMVMAGCASDDMIGDNAATQSENQVIGFNMNMPAVTRAGSTQETGATAAKTLGYEFIVWGEKNEVTKAATDVKNLVFKNYRVQYQSTSSSTSGAATSSPTNTNGWEYVGINPYEDSKVSPAITESQTIKYWDFKANNYVFTAVSALKTDIDGNKVKITKTEGGDNIESANKGYVIELTNGASAANIFVADRNPVTTPTSASDVKPVKMQFRNFQTKIRFGFYETVPGYDVQITGVKYNSAQTASTTFGVDGDFVTAPTGTDKVTYTVTYDSSNKPVVTVARSGNSATASYMAFGSDMFNKDLGTASSSPTYDTDATNDTYTAILPNTGNTTPMTFTVSYKLISEDTGEEIQIDDRQVTVPAAYCMWKPNFAYTYLFKVTDKSAELYPITFDAVVEADEVSNQKTITEVAGETTDKVCITTLGKTSDGKFYTDVDEYAGGSTIYASVTEGSAVQTLTATSAKLYTVTATKNSASVPEVITEAAVANCLNRAADASSSPSTWTVTDLNDVTMVVTASSLGEIVGTVPAEDGGQDRSLSALKWVDATASGTTYYVVEYTKTTTATPAVTTKYYKVVKVVK